MRGEFLNKIFFSDVTYIFESFWDMIFRKSNLYRRFWIFQNMASKQTLVLFSGLCLRLDLNY